MQQDLLYSKTHEWARIENEIAVVGITDFAQEQLGDITFVELPAVGDTVEAGREMGSVESVKAASELYSPVSGEVIEVNEALRADPSLANSDPLGSGWFFKVRMSDAGELSGLLDATAYQAFAADN